MIGKPKLRMALLLLLVGLLPAPIRSASPESGRILGGPGNAPVKLEVFSDFQCPSCREFYLEAIIPVLRDYASKGKVCVIYHEFPLNMHLYARDAARFSIAAYRLGQLKWVPVLDSLYQNQAWWSLDGSVEATVSRAMSREDFQRVKQSLQDPSINRELESEIALGKKREIKSTPTIFIIHGGGEEKVEGGIPYLVLKQYLDQITK
jgi:protein-disulfide isomerase